MRTATRPSCSMRSAASTCSVGLLLALGCSGQARGEPGAGSTADDVTVEPVPPRDTPEHDSTGELSEPPPTRTASCPAFEIEDRPSIPITVNYEELWRAPSIEYQPQRIVVDEGALYWSDVAGNVWMLGAVQTEPVLLRPSPSPSLELVELIASSDYLYFGEATKLGTESGPPSRLLRLPKSGGEASIVYESATARVFPIGVVDERVIVTLYTQEIVEGHWQVDVRTGELSALPLNAPARLSRVVADHLYWLDPVAREVPGTSSLWRADLRELQPEHLTEIRGTFFDVGPGYVLSREGDYEGGPAYFVGQRFVKLDEASGCAQRLPGNGTPITPTMTVDATHAYWQRDNSAQAFSPENPPAAPIFRTNIEDGASEWLETPGLVLDAFNNPSNIYGQDRGHVYLMAGPALIRVDKP